MGQTKKRVLDIFLVVVFLLFISLFLGRNAVAKACYGDLESFSYYSGGGVAGYYENYSVARDGDEYTLMARVVGADGFDVAGPVDASVADKIRDIITEQSLYLRNGVDESQEGLYDGMGETLEATFERGRISYNYYGTSVYRNAALADYLLALSKDCLANGGTSIAEATAQTKDRSSESTAEAAAMAGTVEITEDVTMAGTVEITEDVTAESAAESKSETVPVPEIPKIAGIFSRKMQEAKGRPYATRKA